MSKFSVKRPYTVLVAVVMLIVLGIVSFMKLTTDLLPTLSIPYVMVMTTYPGASPERVESDVTQVLEAALGTVNGVENVTSTSSENFSMVTLEFSDDTDMDSAMVKLSTQINQLEFPDKVNTPALMELSPDMMATMYVAVDYEGNDIYDLTTFVDEEVVPHFERQEGVASVTPTGMVEKTVEIRLDKKKVDALNAKVLGIATDKLDEAQAAGADFVGGEELIPRIQNDGWFDFDVVVATPDMMGVVGRLGRVLGPKGLMPNPKAGTVTMDVTKAVNDIKAGKIEYRLDKTNIIHCPVGKASFTEEQLADNFQTLMGAIIKAKPGSAKGTYLKSVTLASTMGPGVKVNAAKLG